ncbi:MAG: hypothetical protein LUI14_06295 [Lachnospiraceae bacterium]|nr:hypothetical protein [Lachnospiraceae bacterium]
MRNRRYHIKKSLRRKKKKNIRQAKAHALAEKVREKGNNSEITFLVELQKAKEKSSDYETIAKEWQTTELLCQILVCKLYTEVVPYDILDKSYDLDLIDSEKIRDLLKENGYEFDYKCYRDDFIGDCLSSPTIIQWKGFIEICKSNAERILGCKISI